MNKESSSVEKKKQYKTIKEYLEKYLYPDLKIAINELIYYIREPVDNEKPLETIEAELTKEFRLRFYENNADYNKKQKELLELERGSDYSEADYQYYMKNDDYMENKEENEENEVDPDFEDINDEELNNLKSQLEHEEVEKKFNPIAFISNSLKKIIEERNSKKKYSNDFDQESKMENKDIEDDDSNK